MKRRHLVCVSLAALVLWLPVLAGATPTTGDVEIDVFGADGHRFATFPVHSEAYDVRRAYLAARNGERYRIRVRNRSARRVGLVIAVDGRNIISGARSELAHHERMYVLEPWESAQYEGWRTGSDRVNEFYFTDWSDSYAEAFGDRSARGVIAVAVYRERHRVRHFPPALRRQSAGDTPDNGSADSRPEASHEGRSGPARDEAGAANDSPAAPSAGAADSSRRSRSDRELQGSRKSRAESQPGTGFGDEVHSPVRLVSFEAQRSPAARHFIKYEWHETLCRKGLIACEEHTPNRFWDTDDGYAPYPPGRS